MENVDSAFGFLRKLEQPDHSVVPTTLGETFLILVGLTGRRHFTIADHLRQTRPELTVKPSP